MPAKKLTLSIPKPCHEDWDKMTINEKGRHCANCNKTVVDFSLYSEKDLVEFFKSIPTNICGHIPAYRLDTLLVEPQKKRFPWFRSFMWGTAIASWLGLADKAEAQTNNTAPITQVDTDKIFTKGDMVAVKPITTNHITLSFYDQSSKVAIQYVNVTLNINGTLKYYSSSEGICKIPITKDMLNQTVSLSFSIPNYDTKEIRLTVTDKNVSKKVSLKYHPVREMVNGGMVAHPVNGVN